MRDIDSIKNVFWLAKAMGFGSGVQKLMVFNKQKWIAINT